MSEEGAFVALRCAEAKDGGASLLVAVQLLKRRGGFVLLSL